LLKASFITLGCDVFYHFSAQEVIGNRISSHGDILRDLAIIMNKMNKVLINDAARLENPHITYPEQISRIW
jgi:hypothetical protein